jgi:hypothetical protein
MILYEGSDPSTKLRSSVDVLEKDLSTVWVRRLLLIGFEKPTTPLGDVSFSKSTLVE